MSIGLASLVLIHRTSHCPCCDPFCPARRPASSASLIWNQNIRLSPHASLSSVPDTMTAPRESNRSGNSFLVSGMFAALGASTCCEGGLKFLCGSQPEIRDGSDQKEGRGAEVGMYERANSTPF